MRMDFSQIEDVQDFVSVPEGTYACRVAEVREGRTRDGNPRWAMRLEVAEGEYAGRTAAWDGLSWTERGLHRVKFVLEKLGFDVRGELDLEPGELVGRQAVVELLTEEWEDPLTGNRQLRLRVPYAGYQSADALESVRAD